MTVEEESLCYSLPEGVLNTFKTMAQRQWDASRTLPDNWKFDLFTMAEYKELWIAVTAMCYIHFCS